MPDTLKGRAERGAFHNPEGYRDWAVADSNEDAIRVQFGHPNEVYPEVANKGSGQWHRTSS